MEVFLLWIAFFFALAFFTCMQTIIVYKGKRKWCKWTLPSLILILEIIFFLATFNIIYLPRTYFLSSGNAWYTFPDYVDLLLYGIPILFLGMPIGTFIGTKVRKKCSP